MAHLPESPAEAVAELPGARPLSGAPRPVRHLAPPETPWQGSLAVADEGSCFLVDAALLRGWSGWDADPEGHVLAPTDVVRRSDGHDVVLPVCAERLVRFLQRRAGRGIALTRGETVTVLVSILRGTTDVLLRSPHAAGEWWLTDAGKPVFVYGGGPDAVMAADLCLAALGDVVPQSAELRVRLGAGDGVGRGSASADLAHPRALAAALPEIEAALFSLTAPEPLATTDLAPARARAVGAVPDQADDILAHTARGRRGSLVQFVDSDLREIVAVGWDALRTRRRRRSNSRSTNSDARRRRPRVLLIAGIAGAAVVLTGLLWPQPDPVPAARAREASRPTASMRVGPTTPTPKPSRTSTVVGEGGSSQVVAGIQAMLAARLECGQDEVCRGSFAEDPETRLPSGAIDDATRSVVLLDDFGGAAVARVTSTTVHGSGRSQLVVVIHSGKKWLIRDVDDAADQPR